MKKETATSVFESLSSAARLDIFRLLVKAAPQGLVAGELSTAIGMAPSNVSFHLKTLTHSKLVTVVQEGRFQRYRANLALMQEVIAYMTEECCAGHPERCGETCNPLTPQPGELP
ncbi:MAG: helix-turn-helix transcriptional regulator [Burkholderiales bacterium]|nr:helix-turn-helix transcriptional regulator [Burkholderiales bacterium]